MRFIKKKKKNNKISTQFDKWASIYFAKTSNNLNCFIPKTQILDDFITKTGVTWTTARFHKAIKTFVANCDYIECLNPPELRRKDGRIITNRNGKIVEMYYLKIK